MNKRGIFGIIGWMLAFVLGIMYFLQEHFNAFDHALYLIGTLIAIAFVFPSFPDRKRKQNKGNK